MGFFGGHDRACQCKSCGATPITGRGARPVKISKAQQRRNEDWKLKQTRDAERRNSGWW
jgi:hypothetical protein